MARRGEDEFYSVGDGRRNNAVAVDRHAHQLVTGHPERIDGAEKSRIFERDRTIELCKQGTQDRQGVLCAQCDEDLVRTGDDAARAQQALAHLLDQIGTVAFHGIAGPQRYVLATQRQARTFPPVVDGKKIRIDLVVDEGIGIASPVQWIVHGNERGWPECDRRPGLPLIG